MSYRTPEDEAILYEPSRVSTDSYLLTTSENRSWYGKTSAHLPPLNNKWYDSAIASGTLIEGKGDGTWTWGGLCIACLCIVTACVIAFVVVSRFLPTH